MARLNLLRMIYDFIRRENLHRLFLILVVLILVSAVALHFAEPDISFVNALWLSIVTLTTVGYGDITPVTLTGRIIGIIVMMFGIGVLGMFTASIASIFVEKRMKQERGQDSFDFTGHMIVCSWNHRAEEIIRQLRADKRHGNRAIVLVAEVEIKPVEDEQVYFIHGAVNEENLKRANLSGASTVIILGDDHSDATARDAKVVLSALTVESINPDAYTIVELVDNANVQHCKRANADEIIVGSEFASRLMSRAALDHGISKVISELLSPQEGSDLSRIALPADMAGLPFLDVFTGMKQKHNYIVLAIQHGTEVISNPPADRVLEKGEELIVISRA
jgi:voltage-gated potassium channel